MGAEVAQEGLAEGLHIPLLHIPVVEAVEERCIQTEQAVYKAGHSIAEVDMQGRWMAGPERGNYWEVVEMADRMDILNSVSGEERKIEVG